MKNNLIPSLEYLNQVIGAKNQAAFNLLINQPKYQKLLFTTHYLIDIKRNQPILYQNFLNLTKSVNFAHISLVTYNLFSNPAKKMSVPVFIYAFLNHLPNLGIILLECGADPNNKFENHTAFFYALKANCLIEELIFHKFATRATDQFALTNEVMAQELFHYLYEKSTLKAEEFNILYINYIKILTIQFLEVSLIKYRNDQERSIAKRLKERFPLSKSYFIQHNNKTVCFRDIIPYLSPHIIIQSIFTHESLQLILSKDEKGKNLLHYLLKHPHIQDLLKDSTVYWNIVRFLKRNVEILNVQDKKGNPVLFSLLKNSYISPYTKLYLIRFFTNNRCTISKNTQLLLRNNPSLLKIDNNSSLFLLLINNTKFLQIPKTMHITKLLAKCIDPNDTRMLGYSMFSYCIYKTINLVNLMDILETFMTDGAYLFPSCYVKIDNTFFIRWDLKVKGRNAILTIFQYYYPKALQHASLLQQLIDFLLRVGVVPLGVANIPSSSYKKNARIALLNQCMDKALKEIYKEDIVITKTNRESLFLEHLKNRYTLTWPLYIKDTFKQATPCLKKLYCVCKNFLYSTDTESILLKLPKELKIHIIKALLYLEILEKELVALEELVPAHKGADTQSLHNYQQVLMTTFTPAWNKLEPSILEVIEVGFSPKLLYKNPKKVAYLLNRDLKDIGGT